ncbi:MAG: hypothetical protein HZB55_16945 [Deltaproteobacteria bacterium]|nr:hypothetical protein [Deltaproteobacteria bacterium]
MNPSQTTRFAVSLFVLCCAAAAPAVAAPGTGAGGAKQGGKSDDARYSEHRAAAEDAQKDQVKAIVLELLGPAGEFAGRVDGLLLDPFVTYLTTPNPERPDDMTPAGAAFRKLLEGAIDVWFPAMGWGIKGGKLVVGTSVYAVEEMYRQGRLVAIDRMLFGPEGGPQVVLGNVDGLFAQASFFGAYTGRHGINPENIGQRVRSVHELRRLWFEQYRSYLLSSGPFSLPSLRQEVDRRLRSGWDSLEQYWRARRADYVLRRMESAFAQKYPDLRRAARAGLASGDQDRDTPAPGLDDTAGTGPPATPSNNSRQVQEWRDRLRCLEEGVRKHPNAWLDCNGNWTLRSRDAEIEHLRELLRKAGAGLAGDPTPASPESGRITVLAGTYGGNCGVPRGNVTAHLAGKCNGRARCEYLIDYQVIGDPAFGCAKNYVAEWTCPGDRDARKVSAAPEAGYRKAVSLSCP